MSTQYNKEQIIQEIGILKILLSFSLAILISLIAYLFQNTKILSDIDSFIVGFTAGIFIFLASNFFLQIKKFISLLGKE